MSRSFAPDEVDSIWGSCWYGPLKFLLSFPSLFISTLLISLIRVLRLCRMLVFTRPQKSPRAWKSVEVGAGLDVQVLHTTSLLSGFCSEAGCSHLGLSRGYFQLLALSLQEPWSSLKAVDGFLPQAQAAQGQATSLLPPSGMARSHPTPFPTSLFQVLGHARSRVCHWRVSVE